MAVKYSRAIIPQDFRILVFLFRFGSRRRSGFGTGVVSSAAGIANAQIEAEAVPGKPYGVGAVSLALPPGQRMADPASGQVTLSDRQGRILYPIFEVRPLGRLLAALASDRGG